MGQVIIMTAVSEMGSVTCTIFHVKNLWVVVVVLLLRDMA